MKDVCNALKQLIETRFKRLHQLSDRMKLNGSEFGAQLAMYPKSDVSHSIIQAGKLNSRICCLAGDDSRKYKTLQEQFNTARRGTENAWTLLDAANAAAEMRAYLSAMEDLSFFQPIKATDYGRNFCFHASSVLSI